MLRNRIRRFLVERPTEIHDEPRAGFAPLPGFAAQSAAGPVDIYRLAYEQAQRQVAQRREKERTAHEWN